MMEDHKGYANKFHTEVAIATSHCTTHRSIKSMHDLSTKEVTNLSY